jgi:hypothetical protein
MLSIVCDAWDSLLGMRLGKKQRDRLASIDRQPFKLPHMNTKTAQYLKTWRRKIMAIMRLLPGLQTMQFGIGM